MNTDDALAAQLRSPKRSHDTNHASTPKSTGKGQKVLNGRITKPRKSPRALSKKDYKAIEDPFLGTGAMDENGERIFATDHSDSEDTFASDKGYNGEDGECFIVKVEQNAEMDEAVYRLYNLSEIERRIVEDS